MSTTKVYKEECPVCHYQMTKPFEYRCPICVQYDGDVQLPINKEALLSVKPLPKKEDAPKPKAK